MSEAYEYDVVVIGSGPGGYVAAIRASQLGMKAAVIERDKPGGVCLNIGCIPSKALIHQAELFRSLEDAESLGVKVDRGSFDYRKVFSKSRKAADRLSKGVQSLLRKNEIAYIEGEGRLTTAHEVMVNGERRVTGKNVLIATGSRPREIPGFEIDEEKVISSTGALMLESLPESLAILGAGAIGMEFASIMSAFGVDVTVIEMLPRILPIEDPEVVEVARRSFKRRGIVMHTGAKAESMKRTKTGVELTVSIGDGKKEKVAAEKLLVAVGRAPNSENVGLEDIGIELDRGFIEVGDYYQTAVRGVYAIGDVIPTPLLAHVASKEGEIAVEHMAGHDPEPRLDSHHIPSAVYCEPQIASFGFTEEAAQKEGVPFAKAVFPYRGAGKSVAVEKPDGMVKILYDPKTKEILGAHVVGSDATELIHELLLAKKSELLPEDVATMVHAHPTLSEAVMEAARAAEGWAIHV